jgi:hypothetical protein
LSPRSRVGVYLGQSLYHAGSITLILSLITGLISPQYHAVFDDNFSTIENLRTGTVPANWVELNNDQQDSATTEIFLANEWLVHDGSPVLYSTNPIATDFARPSNEGEIQPTEGDRDSSTALLPPTEGETAF